MRTRVIILVILLCGCNTSSAPDSPSVTGKGARDTVRERYRAAYNAWKVYIRTSVAPTSSSRTQDYISNEHYEAIVALGTEAIPYIIQDLERVDFSENGDFFLNDALRRITGVDVKKHYNIDDIIGEQGISRLWVQWWHEQQKHR